MEKLRQFIKNNYWSILIGAIIIYIIIVLISLNIKYNNFGYNAMDLAIFNQVFFNSSQGHLFYFTIHPHSYLGDHFTPFLLFLLPIYYFFQSPLNLLFLQTIVIALSTIPIYLLAKYNLNKTWALILPIFWLINPAVINMNFFEFHLLPFATFLLLFTIYFYQKRNFKLFFYFSLLSLTVREDVFLVILMFSILALLQKRKIKWILTPLILSISWFIISQMIITPHSAAGSYKFISYYNWLGGNSMLEIIKNYLTHPLAVIKHLFLLSNIAMTVALLMFFLFLPLLQPAYLLLSFLIYLQLALTKKGGGSLVFSTHYVALFLPGIIASFILALKKIYGPQNTKSKFIKILRNNKNILFIIMLMANIYLLFILSPLKINWHPFNKQADNFINTRQKIKQELLKSIPPSETTASSYEFLAPLSSRPKIYSLNYAWRGYKQLSFIPYEIPHDLEYLYVNFDDILKYEIAYNSQNKEKFENSFLNWRKMFSEYNLSPVKIIDTYGLWKYNPILKDSSQNKASNYKKSILYEIIDNPQKNLKINNPENIEINKEIKFLGWNKNQINNLNRLDQVQFKLIPISLYFQKNKNIEIKKNYQLQLKFKNSNSPQQEFSKIYPLTYGFYPSFKWLDKEIIKINYWFLVPSFLEDEIIKKNNNSIKFTINLVDLKCRQFLDKNLSVKTDCQKIKILKPDLNIVWQN